MDTIKKNNIKVALIKFCERYGSQNKAANALKGVSSATVSQIINSNWDLITDEMWRNIAAQIGYKDEKWEPVQTGNYKRLTTILEDVQSNSLVMAVTGDAGTGKSFTLKQYILQTPRSYLLQCSEFWNKKLFLTELLAVMGRDSSGYTIGEMMHEVVSNLKKQETPMLILDEADKLTDQVLYFFITLYNQLEDECGIVLIATSHLEKRLKKGLKLNKKGYAEIWSRIGRKCVELKGVSSSDIVAICEVNGVKERKDLDAIIADSESDLRRVKRKIHAVRKQQVKTV